MILHIQTIVINDLLLFTSSVSRLNTCHSATRKSTLKEEITYRVQNNANIVACFYFCKPLVNRYYKITLTRKERFNEGINHADVTGILNNKH